MIQKDRANSFTSAARFGRGFPARASISRVSRVVSTPYRIQLHIHHGTSQVCIERVYACSKKLFICGPAATRLSKWRYPARCFVRLSPDRESLCFIRLSRQRLGLRTERLRQVIKSRTVSTTFAPSSRKRLPTISAVNSMIRNPRNSNSFSFFFYFSVP